MLHDTVLLHGLLADYTTEKGETPLMKAAANGHVDVCDLLIEEKHIEGTFRKKSLPWST